MEMVVESMFVVKITKEYNTEREKPHKHPAELGEEVSSGGHAKGADSKVVQQQ